MAHVTNRVGNNVMDVITHRGVEEMHLKKGDTVKAVIKSTEVMLLKVEGLATMRLRIMT